MAIPIAENNGFNISKYFGGCDMTEMLFWLNVPKFALKG